ncbi:polyprenol monophosphomannose synthase [Actinotalea fermentans]|uniref:Dolichol-phosphate mannosyltransferase n=1 Tax=Actinotalea fermentans TaxID=43671 RepID=A0A511YUM4_9CELL|nr:polyprenol monophosphomannose synthase [Actinotalea fermentans]KGM17443.1 dolichol-phosphate mannosyltransferase [Actinotalea fermentans ATCC 43279 = JCM 9966 = DSM 3133]GEN78902.1 dolichol-phosphate mannosyltransferase [Actinotalea fermentans]
MRVIVVVPTYDEAETLPGTLARLRAAVPEADVLVVDDGSPDGTGELAERAATVDPAVHVLHRSGKQGLGKAYVAGFAWALERGYDVVVEMDADGSHQPEELPQLLAVMAGVDGAQPRADLVIGSRWVPGGSVVNWPWQREVLSRGANTFTRIAMGLPVHDATAGFRAYRAPVLASLRLDEVESQGYCFQVDMAWRVHLAGGVIREVPIEFVERAQGRSKMSNRIVAEALVRVTAWGVARRASQVRSGLRRVVAAVRRPQQGS